MTRIIPSLLITAVSGVHAQSLQALLDEREEVRRSGIDRHTLDIDNDSMLLNSDDGLYTSGVRYARSHGLQRDGGLVVYGWRIGQEIYTATDIKLAAGEIPRNEHPYAAWLYGGFFSERYREDGVQAKWGIDVGCLGPCAGGKWAQTQMHRAIDQPLPRGWSAQVRNEFGVVLWGEIVPLRWSLFRSVDVAPYLAGRFGNIYTDAAAGVTLRAGRLNLMPTGSGFHLFARFGLKAVAYNGSLQGGFFSGNSPHTVEPKRIVGEAELGVLWERANYGVRLAVVRRENEIRDMPDRKGRQAFVRIGFFYSG